MAAKEVKSALKNAREAIKNKEYKEALKHCKAVLKLEKNNYNAWVFIGVSACELDQPDQAQTAYRKASELEPEQPLAWQGLANLYEKNNQADFKAELPSVYQKLVTLYESSDIQKCCEVCKKLADLFLENKDYLQVARTFRKLIQLKEDGRGEKAVDKGEVLQLWKQMIQLLADSVEEQDNETQQHVSERTQLSVNSDEAARCFTQLLDLDENSGLGRIGFGVRALEEGKYEEAIKHLAQGLKRMRSSTLAWYSLAQGQIKMHRYRDSVVSCNQGICFPAHIPSRCIACISPSVFQIPHADKDPVLMSFKGRAYLQKGSLDQLSTELLASNPGLADAVALQGLAHLAKDELQQAEQNFLKAVELRPDSWEYYFLLGRLYWHMGKESQRDKSKTQTHLLKAAKLDPFLGPAFRYLGHYYREITKDRVRARGCYKRAFELDNGDVESGAATVDLSMEQGDMDSALEVLKAVTEKATPGSAKWAWMRRGLYHLKIGQHSQAIADLQAALRADPQDCICWECLGEAYLNRRSFTAALKAFARAHQLNQESIYNLYQMAAIKQTLGKFKEAASEYLQIIKREEYVPALKGLGECHLAMARAALEDYLDGRAVDLIQEAISYLFRAVRQRPDLSCLWKLLGDACTATHTVSPNRARVLIPGTLSGLDPPDQEHTLTQTQVLKLGERCYAQALKLMAEAANLWYDLGLNYYHQSSRLTSPEQDPEYKLLLEKSLQCVKKAVMLDSSNHSYWNALGVVAMSKGIENFALAQHSFIKSVKMEANLAHEAFKIAQSLEPLYVRCWIGQALIAETVGSYDTMDLFRHTTELSTHTEGVKGYAFWVCSTLLDKSNRDSELYRYNIIQMNAVSAAQVALCKYTERIQTDSGAFTMLGYLNEHLHLKKQARQAYQRAAELLRSSEQSESLNFALRNYARALCNTGQWDKAVRVYSSTPKEELHDLTGLALACFRAGHLQDSLRAYEQALTVASSEKEKTYILTALAILQHRQGCMDVAKTLLFKCSMLQEPAAESLLSLCALGLVHSDSTLASAALSELLKRTSGQGTVEERCILTCTLLALQGNYSAVQKEAARAVHSNPGNPSLWALLSRLVPQYYPRKADVSAELTGLVLLTSSTLLFLQKALLFSGINQLASGRHSIEDKMRNALKTIQTAVRLCPDDPAGWAALMAACHTENTARLLSSSAPRREGLERQLMTLVSEKGQYGVDWATFMSLCSSYCFEGKFAKIICEIINAACSAALSPEQPAVFLLLRQIQCESLLLSRTTLPSSVLEQLSSAVLANEACVQAWHWLAEVYRLQGLLVQAVMAYRQSLQLASQLGSFSGKVASLLRLALLALGPCMASVQGAEWKDLVLEATTEALKLGPCPIALLIQALLQFSIKMGARETRRLLERIVYTPSPLQPETVTSVARWYLLRHLHAKDDHELMDTLMDHAKAAGDSKLVEFHKQLSS
uniref:SKI3 subunit of superkiller complex n=1 Tax=Scleropages formosus TaxID=113540 RepID=A0A8C9TJ24_SCLFO